MAQDRHWLKYFDADTVARLCHLGFKPAHLVEGHLVGDHRSPFHGFAVEFAGHRQYVPGDDLKHLDWRAYYRTDKYLLKQYEQETNFTAHLLIDISRSMLFEHQHGRKLDYAAFIAVALAQVVINQSDAVAACYFDNELRHQVTASNAEDVVGKVSQFCEQAEYKHPSALGQVLSLLAEQLGRRQIVFVISDLFGDPEATFRGIRRLLDDRHEVVLIQILDPLELDFNIPGRVRLTDLEGGGEPLNLIGHEIRASYAEVFGAYLNDLQTRAHSLGLDYVRCTLDRTFGFHLAEYLSARLLRKGFHR